MSAYPSTVPCRQSPPLLDQIFHAPPSLPTTLTLTPIRTLTLTLTLNFNLLLTGSLTLSLTLTLTVVLVLPVPLVWLSLALEGVGHWPVSSLAVAGTAAYYWQAPDGRHKEVGVRRVRLGNGDRQKARAEGWRLLELGSRMERSGDWVSALLLAIRNTRENRAASLAATPSLADLRMTKCRVTHPLGVRAAGRRRGGGEAILVFVAGEGGRGGQ